MRNSRQRLENKMVTSRCPITNTVSPNETLSFEDYHISYNSSYANYGSDTTALVLNDHVFLILNGDHSEDLINAGKANGIKGCIDLFIQRIGQANPLSEHKMAVGLMEDPFNLHKACVKVIGIENVNLLKSAILNQTKQVSKHHAKTIR